MKTKYKCPLNIPRAAEAAEAALTELPRRGAHTRTRAAERVLARPLPARRAAGAQGPWAPSTPHRLETWPNAGRCFRVIFTFDTKIRRQAGTSTGQGKARAGSTWKVPWARGSAVRTPERFLGSNPAVPGHITCSSRPNCNVFQSAACRCFTPLVYSKSEE